MSSFEALVTADLLRVATLIMGGLAYGLALAEAKLYWARKRTPGDPWFGHKRLDYMVAVRLGVAVIVSGVVVAIALRLGDEELTFRTPVALVSFSLLVYGMRGILVDDQELLDEAGSHPMRRKTDDAEMGEGDR